MLEFLKIKTRAHVACRLQPATTHPSAPPAAFIGHLFVVAAAHSVGQTERTPPSKYTYSVTPGSGQSFEDRYGRDEAGETGLVALSH